MTDTAPTRPMRADARRNYQRLLDQARTAFAERGTDASLDEIARRAGVGIGTLYRHFPTRDALLEALLRERFTGLATLAEDLLTSATPRDALTAWLRAFITGASTYRGLTSTLMATLRDETSELHAACLAMRQAGERVLTRAQQDGQVRADVTALELFTLASGIAWANEQTTTSAEGTVDRLLTLVLSGLLLD
ncbi:TetR/AcrR family transcriptional regulator [Goodfellowiella coeruleoviolacea]|uniref:Transcriptional regulator, TetR family n=1 Tax=Goodfellowiella coeruleoviolacea TaxID=334858 RepID=A0AAE3GJK5_9PSEU|nr:TetR/AcrR family transcriptional regulator [Goodfellowiella coeruleoviolacea]MCP2168723.1 transcriptional regulator, TetR family [Goodfellowiella coeruleoviolacea]